MSLLVVGGNGFVGRVVCRRAVQRGIKVIGLSRSGRPDLEESWTDEVRWIRADAGNPEEIRTVFEENTCSSVISTVGTMVDATWPSGARQLYLDLKSSFQSRGGGGGGPGGAGLSGLVNLFAGKPASDVGQGVNRTHQASEHSDTHENDRIDRSQDTYEHLNRDVHLVVAAEAAAREEVKSFVYFSAVPPNVLNSKIPLVQRYFTTKMDTEVALSQYDEGTLRCTILRPTVMYDDEHLHTLAPAALSKASALLDSLVFARFGFRDVPHLLPTPPVFVDTVADCAVESALNEDIGGILDVKEMIRVARSTSSAP